MFLYLQSGFVIYVKLIEIIVKYCCNHFEMQSMSFKNDSEYAIVVSSWIDEMPGLSIYIDKVIPPHTEDIVFSSVGQWTLGSLFEDTDYYEQWSDANLPFTSCLAKFQNEPGFSGKYASNFVESRFDLKYEKGIIIWSNK